MSNTSSTGTHYGIVKMKHLCSHDRRVMEAVLSTGERYFYGDDPTDDGCDIDVDFDDKGNGVEATLHTPDGDINVVSFRLNGDMMLAVLKSPWVSVFAPTCPCTPEAHKIHAGQEPIRADSLFVPEGAADKYPMGYVLSPAMMVDMVEETNG